MEEKTINNRYGMLFNDNEWNLLYRSVTFRRDNVKEITGKEPDDLTKLVKDLDNIKSKGYITTNNGNTVTEEEMKDKFLCDTCGA
tara:strand:+ start:3044 stop:3298 length:255 start_codon:yes stop_codon:yes gene_type:complete